MTPAATPDTVMVYVPGGVFWLPVAPVVTVTAELCGEIPAESLAATVKL